MPTVVKQPNAFSESGNGWANQAGDTTDAATLAAVIDGGPDTPNDATYARATTNSVGHFRIDNLPDPGAPYDTGIIMGIRARCDSGTNVCSMQLFLDNGTHVTGIKNFQVGQGGGQSFVNFEYALSDPECASIDWAHLYMEIQQIVGVYDVSEVWLRVPVTNKTITVSSDAHCSFDQTGALSKAVGSNLTVTCTPATGYLIKDVLVDGVSVGDAAGTATYGVTLTNIQADHTISATSVLIVVDDLSNIPVRVSGSGSGKILGAVYSSNPQPSTGDTVTLSFVPAAGAKLTKLVLDGVDKGPTSNPSDSGHTFSQTWAALSAGQTFSLPYKIPLDPPSIDPTFTENVPLGNRGTSYATGSFLTGMGYEDIRGAEDRQDAAQKEQYDMKFSINPPKE